MDTFFQAHHDGIAALHGAAPTQRERSSRAARSDELRRLVSDERRRRRGQQVASERWRTAVAGVLALAGSRVAP
jgi:hypothetical protein